MQDARDLPVDLLGLYMPMICWVVDMGAAFVRQGSATQNDM